MAVDIRNYLDVLEGFSDEIKSEVNVAMHSWYPDAVPVTYLFGLIGSALADVFPKLTESERRSLFNHIEQGVLADDEAFSTAVATGLLEGIVGKASQTDRRWDEIEPYLEDESRIYITAWTNLG
ncbi:hypothetical protein JUNP479_1264 [Aeromonas jandaei]|uniref:hypothetical protein n=1 Tax=Aeromonas jandaei TaxID=650 RepID=UPI0019509836|nr:hypothetical protein [Aeromonas jandaei]QSR74253.1 hypothetical protein GP488_18230 [Aeromonas jandaei]BCS48584.1 hypothetical protein JUNP479_1264 [Aeromonas jandaei]